MMQDPGVSPVLEGYEERRRCAHALVTVNGPEGARLAAAGSFLERCLAGMTAALQGYTLRTLEMGSKTITDLRRG